MTTRELIAKLLRFKNIDQQVKLRVVRRDADNVVVSERVVHIRNVDTFGCGPSVCVEADELDAAKEERA